MTQSPSGSFQVIKRRRAHRHLIRMGLLSTWRRQWHPTPVLLPGKSHGRRSLVGCNPWGRRVRYTERLHFHFSLSCIGEGNGNPLQCSCLENPRDRGAWWTTVYGVAQSRRQLKQHQQQQHWAPSMWWAVVDNGGRALDTPHRVCLLVE